MLLDLRMPLMEGVEVVRRIRERDPRARVIVLTTYDTDDEISRALKAGAKAYVLKDISADDLIALYSRRARRQNLYRASRSREAGRGRDARAAHAARMATLRLMADGKANKEIATALDISERTVKTHLGTSVREARRDQPHGSDQGRHAPRPRATRITAGKFT